MISNEQAIQATRVDIGTIEEAPWNVNVVPDDKFEQLKKDLGASGPEACDPIDTCTLDGRKYTCDGAHRLRAAKQLGWSYLYEIHHPEITDEQQARLFNFKRDELRGTVDPFKLAASFKWFQEQGMKQEDIARKFGLDVSTVSRRISLLRLEPRAMDASRSKGLAVSHLEILAAVPPQVQTRIINELPKGREITVESLSRAADDAKRVYKEEQKLKAWLEDGRVRFPACPECKGAPAGAAREWEIPYGARSTQLAVTCDKDHVWSLVTGQFKEEARAPASDAPHRSWPQHVKSPRALAEYAVAARAWCRDQFKRMTSIETVLFNGPLAQKDGSLSIPWDKLEDVRVDGTMGTQKMELELGIMKARFGSPGRVLSVRAALSAGPKRIVDLHYKLNETDNKAFKTYVTSPGSTIASQKDLEDLHRRSELFISTYLPHGNVPEKRKRGRPRNIDWKNKTRGPE